MKKLIFTFITIIILTISCDSAQTPVVKDIPTYIRGMVKDSSNDLAIENAEIRVIQASGVAYSNSDGEFSDQFYFSGEADIEVTAIGYLNYTTTVNMQEGQLTVLDIELTKAEQTTVVAGIIRDSHNNKIIQNATISCGSESTTSNSNGYYRLVVEGNDSFSVTYSASGYATFTRIFSHKALINQNIVLNPTSFTTLVSGTVREGYIHSKLEGITVEILGQQTSTDSEGKYSLSVTHNGSFEINTFSTSHLGKSISVTTTDYNFYAADIILSPYTYTTTVFTGRIRDEYNDNYIENVKIKCGENYVFSDATGNFELSVYHAVEKEQLIEVSCIGYITEIFTIKTNFEVYNLSIRIERTN